jgi:hypothetical protein
MPDMRRTRPIMSGGTWTMTLPQRSATSGAKRMNWIVSP